MDLMIDESTCSQPRKPNDLLMGSDFRRSPLSASFAGHIHGGIDKTNITSFLPHKYQVHFQCVFPTIPKSDLKTKLRERKGSENPMMIVIIMIMIMINPWLIDGFNQSAEADPNKIDMY